VLVGLDGAWAGGKEGGRGGRKKLEGEAVEFCVSTNEGIEEGRKKERGREERGNLRSSKRTRERRGDRARAEREGGVRTNMQQELEGVGHGRVGGRSHRLLEKFDDAPAALASHA